jgi:histone H3/H4
MNLELCLRKLPFQRLVRELVQESGRNTSTRQDYRIQRDALNALQVAAESFLVSEFESMLSSHDLSHDLSQNYTNLLSL